MFISHRAELFCSAVFVMCCHRRLCSKGMQNSCSVCLLHAVCCLWSARHGPADCPQQMNGCDCGAFLCMFALHAISDQDLRFSQVPATYDMLPTSAHHAACDTRLNMRQRALHRAACNDPHGMRRKTHCTATSSARHSICHCERSTGSWCTAVPDEC